MILTDLPTEILHMILYHLDSHTDLYALTRTCKILHNTCSRTKLPFRADFQSLNDSYRLPRNHTFVANIATQLGDWVEETEDGRDRLLAALRYGMNALLNLAAQVSWVKLDDIRMARDAPDEITPFLDKLYATETEPLGLGRIDSIRLYENQAVDRILFFIVYCLLFRHDADAQRQFAERVCDEDLMYARLEQLGVRWEFIRHCSPPDGLPTRIYYPRRSDIQISAIQAPLPWELYAALSDRRYLVLDRFWYSGKIILDGPKTDFSQPKPNGYWHFIHQCEHLGWPSLLMLFPDGFKTFEQLLDGVRSRFLNESAEGLELYPILNISADHEILEFNNSHS